MKKTLLQLFLFIIIVGLGYFVYQSIMEPVRFNKEKNAREAEVIQNLKDIRSAQLIFKQLNGTYAQNFDTLVWFLDAAEIPVIKIINDPTDTTFTRTISDTLGYVKVSDSLFGKRQNYNLMSLSLIPFSEGEKFEMNAGVIERSGMDVNVFEAVAPYTAYLKGMDEQTINNLIAKQEDIEKYAGLKVGSMAEPSTDGNWE